MEQELIGLDVSKGWLDGYVAATGRRFRVGNDPAGIDELVRHLDAGGGCLAVMEASGGYERTAQRELAARGVPAAIVNPKRVRDFARGMGLEAKTDRIDARLIARYGAVMRPAATAAPEPARQELREILAARRPQAAARAAAEPGRAGPRGERTGLPAAGGQGPPPAPA